MRAWLAISFTIGLWAACYIVSALVYFDFGMVLIWGTALWAGIDSSKIQLNRYKVAIACRPAALFCVCALLWILFFPWYLWARYKIKTGVAVLKEDTTNQELRPFQRFFRRILPVTQRGAEWLLIGLVALKIGFEVFCLAESWRGKRAWEACELQLAAKGEVLDWNSIVPPPVPDSQNIFAAPKMSEWFIKPSGSTISADDLARRLKRTNTTAAMPIANVTVAKRDALPNPRARTTLKFADLASSLRARELIQDFIGPSVFGVQRADIFVSRSPDTNQLKPLQMFMETAETPTPNGIGEFFNNYGGAEGTLKIKQVGSNSFQIFAPVCIAADYLAWSEQFQDDFNVMSEALKRPYARMKGEYRNPTTIPIQNFISFRAVVQTLAQRAQCYLLLGKPEKALQELTLLRDLSRLLEGAPTGKPMSLVTAMINVAVAGLYVDVIADGFRLHTWQEPQLAVLQRQLGQINLAPFVVESIRSERVSVLAPFEANVLAMLETPHVPNATLWQKFKNLKPPYPLRGFFYMNMVTTAELDQKAIESFDPIKKIVLPKKLAEVQRKIEAMHPYSPYTFYASIAVSVRSSKPVQTFAHNQTKVDEAQIVCALERFRLMHDKYPDDLNDLIPQFIDRLPHDIISGQPLKYRRMSEGRFLLYSVGWNETDDGGQHCVSSYDKGDWVWP